MKKILQKTFQIYPGEGIKSLSFLRLAFFWSLGITILETLSDGLFLEKLGSQYLPLIFFITALTMIGSSLFLMKGFRFAKPCKNLMTALGATSVLCLAAAFLMLFPLNGIFLCVLKISSKALFCVLFAFVWTFVDQYHDLHNAKRVYALYSSIFFVGNICAGTLLNIGLDLLDSGGMLLIAAASLLIALLQVRKISLTPPLHSVQKSLPEGSLSPFSIIRMIIRSPFTVSLLSLSLITQLLIIVSEYSYMDSFVRMFQTLHGTESVHGEITEFLGKCRAWISGCNILIGIFFYGRFIQRIGLNNVMLISPLFFLMVYSEWVVYDTLLIAILGLIAVDGIRFTIEDNCFNLLSKAVPETLRPKVRIVNDSFFEPIGMLLGSLLLCGMQWGSRWIGLVLSATALVVALILRERYHKTVNY
jgi:ATP/ADP translocase